MAQTGMAALQHHILLAGLLTIGMGVRLVVVHCTLACLHTGQPHSSCCSDVMAGPPPCTQL